MAETDKNKTEEATPFKLKRAREKGSVARGADLGFFAMLVGLAIFSLFAGGATARALVEATRRTLAAAGSAASDPLQTLPAVAMIYVPALQSVALLAVTVAVVVVLLEIIQIRGVIFSAQPLKPDFSRLDPAKGLKRLFSMRMLKETLKSILKMAAFSAVAFLAIRYAFEFYGRSLTDPGALAAAMHGGGERLLYLFALLALAFAALDQIIVRGEFRKQMRMSRSEFTREAREREGEPRLKQRRKQLHAEFAKQTKGLGTLAGSDMLIVNPHHYAVALTYNANTMTAPMVTAKGRNMFAIALKRKAASLSIAIFEHPPLARSLYRACGQGDQIPPHDYRAVVDLYLKLAREEPQGGISATI